ncbi:hypothetical protein [Escherichia coli]|nr:hypothetical protein [Escherichia coli]
MSRNNSNPHEAGQATFPCSGADAQARYH